MLYRIWIACGLCLCCIGKSAAAVLLEYKPPTLEELTFMRNYGYLYYEEAGSGEYTFTAQSISSAILKMQEFAGIPKTGILDDKTKELFHKKRCGMPDIVQSYHNGRFKRFAARKGWDHSHITYKVINGSSTITKGKVEALMQRAFDVWAPYGRLHFTRTDDSKADIDILFTRGDHGDGNSFDGPGNVVAHAFAPPHGGMHFDDEEAWGENEWGEDDAITDFYAVAVHEIGHALGLNHSSAPSSIMFPYYQVPATGLSDEDVTAMYELYLMTPLPSAVTRLRNNERERLLSTTESTTTTTETVPDLCSADYDVMAVVRQSIFVFKDKWLWIFRSPRVLSDGYPVRTRQFFKGLPENVNIDAVYERKDEHIIIFSDKDYWIFDPNFENVGTGHAIFDYGLPNGVSDLTAVFRSNYNNKTYLFQEKHFYRFDEDSWTMDPGYPRSMDAWRNIPFGINSVFVWEGDTYLCKGPRFWRFDNERIIAHQNYPIPTATFWFGCPMTRDMIKYRNYP